MKTLSFSKPMVYSNFLSFSNVTFLFKDPLQDTMVTFRCHVSLGLAVTVFYIFLGFVKQVIESVPIWYLIGYPSVGICLMFFI